MKTCKKCNVIKPLNQFYADAGLNDGLSNTCKDCKNTTTHAWREANREKYNADMRAYTKAADPYKRYLAEIKRRYGCTQEKYEGLLRKQNNMCGLDCGRRHNPEIKKGRLYVDHCHITGKIRSLLCHQCNCLLGYANDNSQTLLNAVDYVIKHK